MTDTAAPQPGDRKGMGALGVILIILLLVILAPWLIAAVLGVAGAAIGFAWAAVGGVIAVVATLFAAVVGVLGALLGIFASFGVVLLLLLPGILIGLFLASAFGLGKGKAE